MDIQPVTYRGRTVAAATRSRIFLAEALDARSASDPELTFVMYMCAYAGDMLPGELPGPYIDDDARRYARACLVPGELLERAELDLDQAARARRLPADELRAAREEDDRGGVLGRLVPPRRLARPHTRKPARKGAPGGSGTPPGRAQEVGLPLQDQRIRGRRWQPPSDELVLAAVEVWSVAVSAVDALS